MTERTTTSKVSSSAMLTDRGCDRSRMVWTDSSVVQVLNTAQVAAGEGPVRRYTAKSEPEATILIFRGTESESESEPDRAADKRRGCGRRREKSWRSLLAEFTCVSRENS